MKNLITIYLCLAGLISSAQLTTSKDTVTSQGEISWNIGHVIYDSYENNTGSIESPLTIQLVVTSVEEEQTNTVAVFPNPVVENLTIQFASDNEANFQLVNSSGEILFSGNQTSLNMSSYPNGIYFVQFLDHKKSIKSNYKIVKQ